jgi:ABC-type transporter Mla maintaining outer membrane lipid asymmetry permease subunit MlaE
MNRPLVSVAAALALLGGMLVAQHYLDRAPDASLSALPTATAETVAVAPGTSAPMAAPAHDENGLESTMASDAMGAAGGR